MYISDNTVIYLIIVKDFTKEVKSLKSLENWKCLILMLMMIFKELLIVIKNIVLENQILVVVK